MFNLEAVEVEINGDKIPDDDGYIDTGARQAGQITQNLTELGDILDQRAETERRA